MLTFTYMRVQLDRFEDDGWAVLLLYPDGRRSFDAPRELLPEGAASGDVFEVSLERDTAETERLARENRRLMGELLGEEMSFERLAGAVREAVRDAYGVELDSVHVERPNDPSHGDFATNVALANARVLKRNPREVAENLVEALDTPLVAKAEVAGPGFVNFWLTPEALWQGVGTVLGEGRRYGREEPSGDPMQLEFVSANPTGPMTVAHGRHAAYGDSLARILEAAGRVVSREYYFNDGGTRSGCSASLSQPGTPGCTRGVARLRPR